MTLLREEKNKLYYIESMKSLSIVGSSALSWVDYIEK